MYIPSFVTLEEIKDLSLGTEKGADDAKLKSFCLEASDTLEVLAHGRRFGPSLDTVYLDLPENASCLRLGGRDLLEVTTFTTGNDGYTLASTDYFLKNGEDYGNPPYNLIEMSADGNYPNLLYSGTSQQSQKIIGWWGHVQQWDSAWKATSYGVSAISGNTLTVKGNVDALNVLGTEYQYPVLGILKIDSELMLIGSRNPDDNTLTVERGINGTTEAAHAEDAEIYLFLPDKNIRRIARRLASWFYRRKTQAKGDIERPIVTPSGVVLPAKFPVEIVDAMDRYRYAGFN